jgi:N-methylhydantoinase B
VKFDPISLEILWNRLVAITDEAAATLIRTSFSTIVRESLDFACVLLDAQGRSLAQCTVAPPSFIGTLPRTVKELTKHLPPEEFQDGDVLITNDPWIGTGHLPDLNMAKPIFYQGRLIAYAATVSHLPDIGGRIRSPDAREVYEEGLQIPPWKLLEAGQQDDKLIRLIRHNVRVPDRVMGDIWSQLAANQLMECRLIELLEEQQLSDLEALADEIITTSRRAMVHAIREMPKGEYSYSLQTDGFDTLFTLSVTIRVLDDRVQVDYTGTSPQVGRGLNVVPNYTFAFTTYALKCILAPTLLNNEGCFEPIDITAPPGCLLNPIYPAAVGARAITGHFLPTAIFGALAQAYPGRMQAASAGCLWAMQYTGFDSRGERFSNLFFLNGGQGASSDRDGISCISFPGNISNTPIEMIEETPVLIETKALREGSGGAGRFRGGHGQVLTVRVMNTSPLTVSFLSDRTKIPAPGFIDGLDGALGSVTLNGRPIHPKETIIVQPGDLLVLSTPGGAGYGDPQQRDPWRVQEDVAEGVMSVEKAQTDYGWEGSSEARNPGESREGKDRNCMT